MYTLQDITLQKREIYKISNINEDIHDSFEEEVHDPMLSQGEDLEYISDEQSNEVNNKDASNGYNVITPSTSVSDMTPPTTKQPKKGLVAKNKKKKSNYIREITHQ